MKVEITVRRREGLNHDLEKEKEEPERKGQWQGWKWGLIPVPMRIAK